MMPADGMMTMMAASPEDVGVRVVAVAVISVPMTVGVILPVIAVADGVIGDVVQDAVDRI